MKTSALVASLLLVASVHGWQQRAPEDELAKEMTHDLEMNFNKIAPSLDRLRCLFIYFGIIVTIGALINKLSEFVTFSF